VTSADQRRSRDRANATSGGPAGWFDDPSGAPMMRWWDGYGWTEQTRPATQEQFRRRTVAGPPLRQPPPGHVDDPAKALRRRDERYLSNGARDERRDARDERYPPNGTWDERRDTRDERYPPNGTRNERRDTRDERYPPNGTRNEQQGTQLPAGKGRHAASTPKTRRQPSTETVISPTAAPQDQPGRRELATVGISAVFAASLVAIAVGYQLDVGALRVAGVLAAVVFGVGTAPLQLAERSSLATRLGVAGIVGLSTLALGGVAMAAGSGWHPLRAAVVIGLIAAGAHIIACRRAIRTIRRSRAFGSLGLSWRAVVNTSLMCTVVGTVLWCLAALNLGHVIPTGAAGFLPKISPLWYAGLILLLTAIVFARHKTEAHAMFALVSLVAAFTLTPALVYGMPRSQSAAKHIRLVLSILSIHYLNHNSGIYQAFSGLFAGIAWVCVIAHTTNVIGIATYWPFIIGLVGLAELRFFFGRLPFSSYRIWVGMTLVVLVNSLGADYFSPQSVGFVLGLGIFGLVLGRDWPGISEGLRIALLVFAGCALAVTHELSPFVVGGVLVVLLVFRVVRPWYVPATIILPIALWVWFNWYVIKGYVSFAHLGSLSNFTPPKTVATQGLSRLPIVGDSSHALLLGLLVLIALASVGFIRTVRQGSAWGYGISAGVGLVLIAANSYGNEGIFRSALFGIPWLAVLALYAVRDNPPRWMSAAFGVVSVGLLATFLVSTFGLDNAGVIRPSDFQALSLYTRQASGNSELLDLSYGDLPDSVTFPPDGYWVDWTQVATQADLRPGGPDAADAAALARHYIRFAKKVSSAAPTQLYAIWSPASAQYAVDYGLETLAESEKWRTVLANSPDWKVVFSKDGTYLYHVVVPK